MLHEWDMAFDSAVAVSGKCEIHGCIGRTGRVRASIPYLRIFRCPPNLTILLQCARTNMYRKQQLWILQLHQRICMHTKRESQPRGGFLFCVHVESPFSRFQMPEPFCTKAQTSHKFCKYLLYRYCTVPKSYHTVSCRMKHSICDPVYQVKSLDVSSR